MFALFACLFITFWFLVGVSNKPCLLTLHVLLCSVKVHSMKDICIYMGIVTDTVTIPGIVFEA